MNSVSTGRLLRWTSVVLINREPLSSVRSRRILAVAMLLLGIVLSGCGRKASVAEKQTRSAIQITNMAGGPLVLRTSSAEFRVYPSGYMQASLLREGRTFTLDDQAGASAGANSLNVAGKDVADFSFDLDHAHIGDASGRLGGLGKEIEVSGKSASFPELQATVRVEVYDDFPDVALSSVSFKNSGADGLSVRQIVTQRHVLNAAGADRNAAPFAMWSFHGSSEAWGKDDVALLNAKYKRENPMQTMLHNDENRTGGGIPVVAFWTGSVGEAIGHAETVPLKLSLPVKTEGDGRVSTSVVVDGETVLHAGESYTTPLTFLAVFHGDFYEPLRTYSKMLQKRGLSLAHPNEADYQANWCGWGYEMDFAPKQMLGTIPKLKELGLKWATLDAGWFRARGDWEPRSDTFPGDSLQKVVKAYHNNGVKITLWWIPLVVEDGNGRDILNHRPYQLAKVAKEHPDWLILGQDGKPARATADLGAFCPAVPEVKQYYKQLTERFIRDWDFDGHKLDFSYTVPACYNPKHHHKSPNDSIEAVGDVYKVILDTTRASKPDSVTQACPCGTPPSLAWLPYIDQAVTADPVGARQVRLRTKMYKALLGPQAAVYGDHVELTSVDLSNTLHEVDKGQDFASEVGVGAVVGTKFTWPSYGPKLKMVELTPEKEQHWKKWIDLYDSKMLSKGEFLNLYIYGYDLPEAYAIQKDGRMYYAFYAPEKQKEWSGEIELRGLKSGRYAVLDYENNKGLGTVESAKPRLKVSFSEHLLLEAIPQ
jgi:alpha-galactosidase